MESQSNNSNGKAAAVLDEELVLVTQNGKNVHPEAATVTPEVEERKVPVAEPDNDSKQEPTPPSEKEKSAAPKQKKRRVIILAALGVVAVVGGVFGFRWWQYGSTHETTDDAYVTTNVHPVSSRINGTVSNVLVKDNQQVEPGQLLVTLDPRDYQVQVQQAQASLEAAQRQANAALSSVNLASGNASGNTQQAQGNVSVASASISTAIAAVNAARAGVPAAIAQVAQADANLQRSQADYNRYSTLYQQGAIPRQQLDTAKATYQVNLAQKNSAIQAVAQAQANLAQAQENVVKAQAQLAASKGSLQQAQATTNQTKINQSQYQAAQAAIAQSQASLKNAQLQLSYTNIYAPSAGRVGNKTVQVGAREQPGTPMMSITENGDWVVANFKETQLERIHPGQQVEVTIDAFPHHPFIGRVDSFSPGSGATFALLPSDNATGNFTKIVQRIPVKILFDPNSVRGYESRIAPGMSVEVSVDLK